MLAIFSYTSAGTQTEAIAANDGSPALATSPLSTGDLAGNSIGPLAASPVTNGLKLWYDMNQTGRVISDLSGNRNNGITIGAKYVKLPSGAGSRSLNGESDYINVLGSAGINRVNDFTIEVLFKADQIDRLQTLLDDSLPGAKSKGYSLQVNANNRLQFIVYNSSGAKSTLNGPGISAGKWYQVVATASESAMTLYVNGEKVATQAYSGMAPSQTNVVIGRSSSKPQSYFDGSISTVRIYNRTLTNQDVLNNYNADLWRTGSQRGVTPTATPTVTITPTTTPTPTVTPAPSPVSSVQWAGHTWSVTDYKGGTFTTNNVWVDSDGKLHMKLVYDGRWHPFNLIQQDNVGYGTYEWTVASDVGSTLNDDPGLLFSPFLFDNSNSREMDVQMSKWGSPGLGYNTNWTVWTPAGPEVQTSHVGGAGNTWTLEWMPDHVKFSVQGPNQPYKEWNYTDTSGIPPATGSMKSLLYIGQYQNAAPPDNAANYQAEVVLSGYTYTPYTPTPTTTPTITPTTTPKPTATPTPLPGKSPSTPPGPVSTIYWKGYNWELTHYDGTTYTTDNVRVDENGWLHMNLTYKDGRWTMYNMIREGWAHYGTYTYTVQTDINELQDYQDGGNPGLLWAAYFFDNTIPEKNYGEIDIELSKWGNPNCPSNSDWTIWSNDHHVEYNHFVGHNNTWTIEWMPTYIKFSVVGPEQPYKEYIFSDPAHLTPDTGNMKTYLGFYQFQNAPPPGGLSYYNAEVIVTDISYTPYTGNAAGQALPVPTSTLSRA